MSVVVATAGHVDHGKSTLVRALTGMDPDRLPAERERGLTIELGYAWGEFAGNTIAFVDVPGHEKFLSTMLAGIGAVPLALVVVAADDPWMPQTAEHLAALDALRVSRGVVAITRTDLADPAPAEALTREHLAGTSLESSPIVPVSAVSGDGIEDLRTALAQLAASAPVPDAAADVRVWIDRIFTVPGAGTVITATLPAGTIATGDHLAGPSGTVRVRGLESLAQVREFVTGPARVALNLTGAVDNLHRGDPLWTAGHWFEGDTLDVRLVGGEGAPPRTPMLHLGAWSAQVRLRLLDDSHAQLRLPAPLPLRQGDRGILRDPGDRRSWGVIVLDPATLAVRGARAREERLTRLARRGNAPALDVEVADRGAAPAHLLRRLGLLREGPTRDWYWSSAWEQSTTTRVAEVVLAHDAAHPADPGLSPAAVANLLDIPAGFPPELLTRPPLLPTNLRSVNGRLTAREVELPERVVHALTALNADFAVDPFAAPSLQRLRELGLTERDLGAAARLRRVFVPASGVVLPTTAPRRAIELLAELESPFTVSQARQQLGTSRRVVLPLLDFLDRAGVTRRLPDDRRELRRNQAASGHGGVG